MVKNSGHPNGSPETPSAKAIAATSGGLDSLLAAEVIRRAGVETTLLHVRHLFSTSEEGRRHLKETAARMGLPLCIVDASEEHLETIRRPKHGYGRGMNPCVDCRIFMLKIAERVMEETGSDFVVTGEVLGQRPKSQNPRALLQAAEESGLGNRLVRPLSANLLPDTLPVAEGWIRKDQLYAIQGRSREPQMKLAREFRITEYPQPAGGCLLTERVYARRLMDAFDHFGRDAVGLEEFKLLGQGRHFRISHSAKAIVGRDQAENEILETFADSRTRLEPLGVMGPTALIEGEPTHEDLLLIASLVGRYCDVVKGEPVAFEVLRGAERVEISAPALSADDPRIAAWRID
jgi:tRNA-specific 2-thiouridylase